MTKHILSAEQSSSNGDKQPEIDVNRKKKHDFLMVQQMINKFLTCERLVKIEVRSFKYTEYELAEKLDISVQELKKLKMFYFYKSMESKIIYHLICLYCSTKWVNDRYREKK